MAFARNVTKHDSDDRVRDKMRNLERIGKGNGWPMYECLKRILTERAMQ